MAINKISIICATLVMFTIKAFGQQRPLKVGDTIPDMVIQNIINQPADHIRPKDLYKNGLLIINFWGTFCPPCIKEIKFLDSLRAKHKDKFSVLSVTSEDGKLVKKFLSSPQNKDITTSNLVISVKNSLLKTLFPHKMLPHNVWIDKEGIVKGITGHGEMTDENILNFNEAGITARTKRDRVEFDRTKEFHLGDSLFTYRSMITPGIEGIGGSGGIKSEKGIRYFQLNHSIVHLFWNAYSNFSPSVRHNLIKIKTRNSGNLGYPKRTGQGYKFKTYWDWAEKNAYCYLLTLPKEVSDTVLRRYMFDDLECQFKIKARVSSEKIPCIVVRKLKGRQLKLSKRGDSSKLQIHESTDGVKTVRNAKIADILVWWYRISRADLLPEPFVYDLEDSENPYFDIVFDFSNAKAGISSAMLFKELEKYGFRFTREIRSYPVLILEDSTQ